MDEVNGDEEKQGGGGCVGELWCDDSRVQEQPLIEEGKGRGGRKDGGREGEGREDHMVGWAPPLVKCGHTLRCLPSVFINVW